MQVGDLYLDLRDKSVVQVRQILLPAKLRESPIVEVTDVVHRCNYFMDAKDLDPREVDPDSVLEWIVKS